MGPCNQHTAVTGGLGGVQTGREIIVHVCPQCGYYDADPVLRRVPGARHGSKRCFACGKRAADALDLLRIAPSARAWRKSAVYDAAPVMVATRARLGERVEPA